ncbi:MAG: hypothetical protein AB7D57_04875 [Desulfovibrionaceae bacterium]
MSRIGFSTGLRSVAACALGLVLVLGWAAAAPAARPVAGLFNSLDRALDKDRHGRTEEARPYWERAAACGDALTGGDNPSAEYVMGAARAWYGAGDPARAADLYAGLLTRAEALGVDPVSAYPWALVWLGMARARLGQADAAVAAWERVPSSIGGVYGAVRARLAAGPPDAAAADALEAAIREAMAQAGWPGQPTLRQLGGAQPGATALDAPENPSAMSPMDRTLMGVDGRWGGSTAP